ncbi:hypothetical protein [Rhizobium ruizarguesonis]|uniref:hypothetical protein n=1 Tax=Rhizobium ruizarguesonis TaxID=2081791 RepID=UPI00102FC689|nr:hypothetical protein [Rhizobium ruizarguesonis]TBD33823.1 hypothetical protein ELH17_35670 [Rhizobium ruizarguesonis]TBD53461.1 hypothetical protein ELH16_34935 [Rhizobium ruizarguesonis]TBF01456.1 hypothetical protein ELG96_33115 [Rhizobium ruizarguesonis]
MVFAYTAANIANLESSHSPERLGPYYALAGGDKELGLKLYAWNSALSQTLYTPLQGLEVALRNALGGQLLAAGRIVAELNWGFWTGILAKRYEPLWRSHFRKAFNATGPLTRDQIFQPLDDLRRLRNRIAHHEPIINRNIAADYASILNLISYISPTTAQWIDDQSEIAAVIAAKPLVAIP